jgi:surface antigen
MTLAKPTILGTAACALLLTSLPAQAQLGGLLRGRRAVEAATTEGCASGSSSSVGSRIMGSLLGGATRDAADRAGISTYVPVSEFTDQLSSEIACKLDPQEQAQAAEATLEATRGSGNDGTSAPRVGASSAWESNTRDDVSGTSTVTARQRGGGDGQDCITVTDVIIVRGEETRADKRMCRPPGSARYSIIA